MTRTTKPPVVVQMPLCEFLEARVRRGKDALSPELSSAAKYLTEIDESVRHSLILLLTADIDISGRMSYRHDLPGLSRSEHPYIRPKDIDLEVREELKHLDIGEVWLQSSDGSNLFLISSRTDADSHYVLLPSGLTDVDPSQQAKFEATLQHAYRVELSSTPRGVPHHKHISIPQVGALDSTAVKRILEQAALRFASGGQVVLRLDLDDSLLMLTQTHVAKRAVLNQAVITFVRQLNELCQVSTHADATFKVQLVTSRPLPSGMQQKKMDAAVSRYIHGASVEKSSPTSVQAIIEAMPDDMKRLLINSCPHVGSSYVYDGSRYRLDMSKHATIVHRLKTHFVDSTVRNQLNILVDDNVDEARAWATADAELAERNIDFIALPVHTSRQPLPSAVRAGVAAIRATSSYESDSVTRALRAHAVVCAEKTGAVIPAGDSTPDRRIRLSA